MSTMLRFAFVCALVLLTACGGSRAYQSTVLELSELRDSSFTESMRIDPSEIDDANVQELRQNSVDMLAACDIYSEYAFDNWQSRKDELAVEYARVGMIYYRAAENFARSADARGRLNEANFSYQEQRRRRNEYQTSLRAEQELVALLTTITALFERNESLRRELATIEDQYQSESRALYAIQESRILQREAEGMKADDFAPEAYLEANAVLARSQQHYDDEEYEDAYDVALRAMESYRVSIEAARSDYLQEQDSVMRDSENQAIFETSQRLFGPDLAFIDARGIVVVLPGLFERNESDIESAGRDTLDQLLELVREFDSRQILLEGHSQDRGATDANMALSQTRSDEVQNYFLQRSVRSSRIQTAGFGEEAPRFDNRQSDGRANNDRVEVVFLFD
ncbi:MAG: outer membrane protein OmpA-like peptidoglycan-associated protein [Bradymonadia bacterium]|jgi:outer membrane protein OmpA-like peptidoglycan-associated protein